MGIPIRIGILEGIMKAFTISPNGEMNIMLIKRKIIALVILAIMFCAGILMLSSGHEIVKKDWKSLKHQTMQR